MSVCKVFSDNGYPLFLILITGLALFILTDACLWCGQQTFRFVKLQYDDVGKSTVELIDMYSCFSVHVLNLLLFFVKGDIC